jgi:hypothetical protein
MILPTLVFSPLQGEVTAAAAAAVSKCYASNKNVTQHISLLHHT